MRDMVAACVVGQVQGAPLLDLNQLEEQYSRGPTLLLALHTNLEKVGTCEACMCAVLKPEICTSLADCLHRVSGRAVSSEQ